jgi:hypothetical protein
MLPTCTNIAGGSQNPALNMQELWAHHNHQALHAMIYDIFKEVKKLGQWSANANVLDPFATAAVGGRGTSAART